MKEGVTLHVNFSKYKGKIHNPLSVSLRRSASLSLGMKDENTSIKNPLSLQTQLGLNVFKTTALSEVNDYLTSALLTVEPR